MSTPCAAGRVQSLDAMREKGAIKETYALRTAGLHGWPS